MKMYPIIKVISGGQTGADLGGVCGAKKAGIATGGTMPAGFRYEKGVLPHELRKLYGFVEHTSSDYPPRTRQNILDSDATLLFGELSGGTRLTLALCGAVRRPIFRILSTETFNEINKTTIFISKLNQNPIITRQGIIINIAGNRESKNPGIEDFVAAFVELMIKSYERVRQWAA